MNARIAFKKRKVVSERSTWIVSVFNTPSDIMAYDLKTMSRLRALVYGKNSKAKNQEVIIREILDETFLNYSNLTIDEYKEQNKAKM